MKDLEPGRCYWALSLPPLPTRKHSPHTLYCTTLSLDAFTPAGARPVYTVAREVQVRVCACWNRHLTVDMLVCSVLSRARWL